MVRDDVENKVANEGCKPGWNERLHMLERRLQRYSEQVSDGSESVTTTSVADRPT